MVTEATAGWDRDAPPPDRPCMAPGRGSAQLPRLVRHAQPRRRRRVSERPSGRQRARPRGPGGGRGLGTGLAGRVRRRRRGGAGGRGGRR
jgi:hypothetical protein